jgi:hypothetical protein
MEPERSDVQRQVPGTRWGIVYATAGVLLLLACGGWETLWRWRGFTPTCADGPMLWAAERDHAANGSGAAVVVLGTSRIQLALDPEAFVEATGWQRPVQLAISGAMTLPVLQHLAADPAFRGTVIMEINPVTEFDRTRRFRAVSAEWLAAYGRASFADPVERRLRTAVQMALVSRQPQLSLRQVVHAVRTRRWPAPPFVILSCERFARADRRLAAPAQASPAALAAGLRLSAAAMDEPQLQALIAETRAAVARIARRGGRVVLVRAPSSGVVRAFERERFPRARYWNVFVRGIGVPGVHFEDDPEMAGLECFDDSHLDAPSRPRFTRALAAAIRTAFARGAS